MENITTLFGIRVRQVRTKRNISQEKLANLCNLHRTYIGSVERGERNITLINAEKISKALDIELFELIKEATHI